MKTISGNPVTRTIWLVHSDNCYNCSCEWSFQEGEIFAVPKWCQIGRKLYLQWIYEDAWIGARVGADL